MKKALLFGALIALLLGCNHAPKQKESTKDDEAFKACFSISDYRSYMNDYGFKGLHYNEAKNIVDKYVADSIVKADARKKSIEKAEEEEKEDEMYNNCNSVSSCDKYLKAYPRGRYVREVEALKAELEKKVAQSEAEKAKKEAEQAKKEAEKAKKEAEKAKKEAEAQKKGVKTIKINSDSNNGQTNKTGGIKKVKK